MIGRGCPARGIGGIALLGQCGLARGGRQRDRPARAGGLGQQRASRAARSAAPPAAAAARSPAGRSAPDAPSAPDARAASPRAARPPGRPRRGSWPGAARRRVPTASARRLPPRALRRHRRAAGTGRAGGAVCAGAAVSRRTRSPGGGMSATWHSRISTISAAARRSGAVSTSATPFSSICQARASTGTDSRSASAAPRVRSASGSSGLSRSAGTDFSRVMRVAVPAGPAAARRDRRRAHAPGR